MGKVKCRYCEEFLLKKDAIILEKENSKGTKIKIFLHKECERDYKELMEYKANEIKWFNELYIYIQEDLLDYNKNQKLPKLLVTRLQDLRNGTIMQKGIGRICKSKEGYPYNIILDTFLSNSESIRWAFTNKDFKSEKNKINYMMAIIDSNINDTYIKFKTNIKISDTKKRDNIIEEEKLINENVSSNQQHIETNKNKGISRFLSEDEL